MWVYTFGVRVASLFSDKAKLLTAGRRDTWKKLESYDNSSKCIWIHAASLGEFEQGRPLMEAIREKYPDRKIVLTFYSPSGYEVRKNFKIADLVCYLPADGPCNAKKFIEKINPEMVFFVKYEFWHFYLKALKNKNIPTYGVSMIFRKQQAFFKWYGGWFRDMLKCFDFMYIQNQTSAELLDGINIKKYAVVGDTRFDRVAKIAASSANVELVEKFVEGAKMVLVAGSSWEPDEDVILPYINDERNDIKLIIAPHEIHDERVKRLTDNLKVRYCLYTNPVDDINNCKVLVINTIGLLSTIYKYGQIAYVGGGFGVGIHNTLEAATYGMPVIFGPNYKRFNEACDLIEKGAGFCVHDNKEFTDIIEKFDSDKSSLATAGEQADKYVKSMCGATDRILKDLF